MADHLVDIYDEAFNHLGTELKSKAHREGLWHASIHCWIIDPSDGGWVLCQKRGSQKELFPNALDITAAGHYEAGEDVAMGVREILEELGLAVEYEDLVPLGTKIDVARLPGLINHEFCHVFLLENAQPISAYRLQRDELDGLLRIRIIDGLRLCSGAAEAVDAEGVEVDENGRLVEISRRVSLQDFIPRVDPYYFKVFLNARDYLAGETYLSI